MWSFSLLLPVQGKFACFESATASCYLFMQFLQCSDNSCVWWPCFLLLLGSVCKRVRAATPRTTSYVAVPVAVTTCPEGARQETDRWVIVACDFVTIRAIICMVRLIISQHELFDLESAFLVNFARYQRRFTEKRIGNERNCRSFWVNKRRKNGDK